MAISLGGFSGGGAGAVTSVNTQTGAVVLSGDDLAADHTASNYTAANANIDGHLSGIDAKFGTLAAGLTYKGTFNASAGTPSLTNALQGDLYIIDTAGTIYGQTWAVGDHLLVNEDMGGSITNSKIDKVDNTDQVTSVNGNTGAVSVNLDSVTSEGNTTTNTIVAGVLRTPYLRVGTSALNNYTFPTADGTLSQVIATDGAGGLYWKDDANDVTSVNTQTGAVVLSGDDLAADHTAVNYTASNANIDGHLAGIDSALGASANPTLDGVTTNGNTTTNAINVGEITASGDILADSADTRTIGAENTRFITYYGDMNGAIRFKAKNDEGAQITKGQAVYIKGLAGDGTTPTVGLADANDPAKMPAFGLAFNTANNSAEIQIISVGNLGGLNTSGFSVGDTLFVDTTAGALTDTKPTGESSQLQNIGRVIRSDNGAGVIMVGGAGRSAATPNLDQDKIFLGNASNQAVSTALSTIGLSKFSNDSAFISDITGESIDDLSDVSITSATSGQVLSYNGTSWVNAAASGGASALDDLSDVSITSAATGEVLRYNGTSWVDAQLAYSDLSGTAPTPFTVTNTTATSYTASANEIINHTGSGSGAATITMPSSAVSGDVVIIRKSSGQGTMITINDPGGSKIQDVQIFPYTGNVMVTYDGTNWIVPRTNYDFQRSTLTAFTLYGYWFGRYVIYADGDASNTFTVNIQVSATSLLEGARQLILCRGARNLVITSPSSDIVDPTDGSATDTLVNSVTVPAHGGIVEIWVNGQGQYIISAPLANLSTVATTGAYSDLSGTPTTVSTFTNDAGYLTSINIVDDGSPQLGGNLDTNSNEIVTTSNANVILRPNGTGVVHLGGNTNPAEIRLYCESADAHYVGFKSPAHALLSGSQTWTLPTADGTNGQVLQTNGSGSLSFVDQAAGGGGWTYSAITADPANAQAGYHYSCTGTFTITLPTSGVSAGEEIRVKNMGTGTITIDPQTQNIDGSTTDYTLDVQYSAITLVSTGTHWEII